MPIGVIGLGYWGPNLVRSFNELSAAEVAAVSDLRPGRLEFIKSRYPHLRTTSNAEEILDDPSIDAVCIATPPATHFQFAIQALNAGKHVLVEKPLAMEAQHAEAIVETAARLNRRLAVGHLFLYAPAVVAIRELIQSGGLGEIYYISSTRMNLGPPNTVVDVLWDLASHDISIILDMLGENPNRVTAEPGFFGSSKFAQTVFVTMHFPSGRMAHVHVSWLTPNKTRVCQLVCSNKVLVYDDMEPVHKVRVYDAGQDNRVDAKAGDAFALAYGPGSVFMPALKAQEPLQAECADFVDSIAAGHEPLSSGRRGLEVVRVLHAASEQIRARGAEVVGAA